MNKWLAIADETKRNAYIQIAEKSGMSAFAVEKDWWVVQTLSVIFGMEVGQHLVFKGGTSLSKAWKLIERFQRTLILQLTGISLGMMVSCQRKKGGDYVKHLASTWILFSLMS